MKNDGQKMVGSEFAEVQRFLHSFPVPLPTLIRSQFQAKLATFLILIGISSSFLWWRIHTGLNLDIKVAHFPYLMWGVRSNHYHSKVQESIKELQLAPPAFWTRLVMTSSSTRQIAPPIIGRERKVSVLGIRKVKPEHVGLHHSQKVELTTFLCTTRSAALAESRLRIDTQSFITPTGYASRNHDKNIQSLTEIPWTCDTQSVAATSHVTEQLVGWQLRVSACLV